LVDDDPDCRMLVRDIIDAASSRADVREAADGRQALDYLRRVGPFAGAPRPDLVYLDIEMPGPSGQEVLRLIKSDPALADIPVVMWSGLDDENERRLAREGGANGYVVKPPDPVRFLQVLTSCVRRWTRPCASADEPQRPDLEPEGHHHA
jgi:CheY-like chemotaxis protein